MGTNEYFKGNEDLMMHLGCTKKDDGNVSRYRLPSENGNSWLVDVKPRPGLIITNAYFTLHQSVTWMCEIEQPGLWLCSFDCGDMTIVEKGKKTRQLQRGVHLLVNRGKSFKKIFGSEEPIRYTAAWIFSDFITKYLKDRGWVEPLSIDDALNWESHCYNVPELVLAFEQLKYGIRQKEPPLMYLETKIIEILSLIVLNMGLNGYDERFEKTKRAKFLTYQNMKFIMRVKAELDKNILSPPPIRDLAVIAGMGTTKLRLLFKAHYKLTIADYVRQEKMNYALRLLWKDDMSIQNISTFLGYESPSKFTVAFKKVHGLTPRDARKVFNL
ncbi:helix-turn-helix domain-containing protein [Pelosinus propionicus]|uniref:AraC-type DNA-binding protein n=1 Tax=Pelosinus propionicus DSM 13327 TaxID=1123291 RepID=A0A1I4MAF4_9FIRM|nr:AraC family transcriptional regulator [Pelosinus propionicus]SFM00291.1 AraC-type DNA-binding protein [Pelosinus propionicus DSM 13327]